MTILEFTEGTVPSDETLPQDETPRTDSTESTGWFDPEYPYSTPEHPFGYYEKPNGDIDFDRPRKRKPYGKRGSGTSGVSRVSVARSPQADKTAKTAAALLARLNSLIGLSLSNFGMPLTAAQLIQSNEVFEQMAYEALQTDPALARKILSAGATSGKAQLVMAYAMLGGTVAPSVLMEVKSKRKANENDD